MSDTPMRDMYHVIKVDSLNGFAIVLEGDAHEAEVLRQKIQMDKTAGNQFNTFNVKLRHGVRYEYEGLKAFEEKLRKRGCTASADRMKIPLAAMERHGHGSGHNPGAPKAGTPGQKR